MNRYPELRPYAPSDRYGIIHTSKSRCENQRDLRRANHIAVGQRDLNRSRPGTRSSEQNQQLGPAEISKKIPETRKITNVPTPSASKPTSSKESSGLSRHTKSRSTFCIRAQAERMPNCSIQQEQKTSACQPAKKETPSRIARFIRTQVVQSEDSGVEVELSSTGVSSSPSTSTFSSSSSYISDVGANHELPQPKLQDRKEEPLRSASEHLDEMARREAEDRRTRMQIVDNILSRFNIKETGFSKTA